MIILFMCATWILVSGLYVYDIVKKGKAPFFWFGKVTWLTRKDDSLYFFVVAAYWIALFFLSFGGLVWFSIQEFNGNRPFYPTTTKDLLLTIVCAVVFLFLLFFLGRQTLEKIKRDSYKRSILILADDISTDPEYLTLQEVVELYSYELINDVIFELKKMSPGNRSLQRAQDIINDDNYIRQA
jgi:hypothetical protein